MESVTSKTKFKDLLSNNNYYPFPEIVSALDSKQIPFKKIFFFHIIHRLWLQMNGIDVLIFI